MGTPPRVSRQEKTRPWGVNLQEPLQVQTNQQSRQPSGTRGRSRVAQGRASLPLVSKLDAGAFPQFGASV